MKLESKAAIVTGAGSRRGIGRALALALARAGADIAVADICAEDAAETAAEIERLGRRAVAVPADVTDSAQVKAVVRAGVEAFGKIDILINNAGFCTFLPFLNISEELWDRTMAVNVKGYFLVGQEVARQMVKQANGGKIINVSSQAADHAGEERSTTAHRKPPSSCSPRAWRSNWRGIAST
jgi:NAD(P)-dependent dehydrogenase (short-subunit alcohol dehydrogenase family)